MRNLNSLILFLALVTAFPALAQDTITELDEVLLSDVRLLKNSGGQVVTILQDSVLTENEPLLGSLLKFNSPIFFRENGYGMVSSPSFRGTTPSQTAVVWNGININSQFNGQTDFNTINSSGYDQVAIRAGGGSVLYGSGAIGGSIHLNNNFRFSRNFTNIVKLEYGSFNTKTGTYSTEAANERTAFYLNFAGISSDNDYPFPQTDFHNRNGDFYNINISGGIAHWLNGNNILKFYSEYFSGERGFSGTLTAPSISKYEDISSRNLLEWKGLYEKLTSTLKLAYLEEEYKYYENRNRPDHSFGDAKNYITNYDVSYRISPSMNISGIVDHRRTLGVGSDVGKNIRDITAFALLFNHDLGKLFYEFSTRKEITEAYSSPLLFSASTGYAITPYYELVLNASKNFRIPTYNDLYWRAGGNENLRPETSYQAELGQNFLVENLEIGVIGYVMKVKDLLRWIPDASGLWKPVNTESVRNYGLEVRGSFAKHVNGHQFNLNSTYAYTQTEDTQKNKELIYVPRHKATGSLSYSYKFLSMFYQFLYNGRIYTSSDNEYSLSGYSVSNLGLAAYPFKEQWLKIGVEIRNLFNVQYESLPSRPMPGRSINSSITFKF